MKRILLVNGPNLNLLGVREPEVYGIVTLADIERETAAYAVERGAVLDCFQSNHEGALIDRLHAARGAYDGIVYNPGAHTHYSYALRDAVSSIDVPTVEVHLSDIDAREDFRKVSVIEPVCIAQIKGKGKEGYLEAVDVLLQLPDAPSSAPQAATPPTSAHPLASAEGPVGSAPQAPAHGEGPRATLRLGRLREACSDAGLDAFYMRDTSSIRWLTALDDVFDDEDAHALLVTPDAAVLHTDSRYAEAARAAASGGPVSVDDARKTHATFVAEALVDHGNAEEPSSVILSGAAEGGAVEGSRAASAEPARDGAVHPEQPEATPSRHPERSEAESKDPSKTPAISSLGIEDSLALADYRALESSFAAADAPVAAPALRETSRLILGLRGVKEPSEVARMRAAQAITDAAFAHIVSFMRPGMTEREVQIELEDFMRRHGAEGLAFPSIVATGANGASPHAVPGDMQLEAGQCVVLDFGARALGYCSDMTRTVFLGAPDARMRDAYAAIRQANEQVQAALRPGVTGKAMHELAEQVLAGAGFAGKMGHSLGHGVGIDIHEEPNLSPRNADPLVEGNVVTVEPGVYLPGEFGMRLEDFGVVTHDGFAVFTQSTHDMVII